MLLNVVIIFIVIVFVIVVVLVILFPFVPVIINKTIALVVNVSRN